MKTLNELNENLAQSNKNVDIAQKDYNTKLNFMCEQIYFYTKGLMNPKIEINKFIGTPSVYNSSFGNTDELKKFPDYIKNNFILLGCSDCRNAEGYDCHDIDIRMPIECFDMSEEEFGGFLLDLEAKTRYNMYQEGIKKQKACDEREKAQYERLKEKFGE